MFITAFSEIPYAEHRLLGVFLDSEGETSAENCERSAGPCTGHTYVRKTVSGDRRSMTLEIVGRLGLSYGTCRQILTETSIYAASPRICAFLFGPFGFSSAHHLHSLLSIVVFRSFASLLVHSVLYCLFSTAVVSLALCKVLQSTSVMCDLAGSSAEDWLPEVLRRSCAQQFRCHRQPLSGQSTAQQMKHVASAKTPQ